MHHRHRAGDVSLPPALHLSGHAAVSARLRSAALAAALARLYGASSPNPLLHADVEERAFGCGGGGEACSALRLLLEPLLEFGEQQRLHLRVVDLLAANQRRPGVDALLHGT